VNFLGIDPGKGGGFVLLDAASAVLDACPMPGTPADILDVLREWQMYDACHATLEHVRSTPAMGVVSAFTFGRCLGHLEAALIAVEIPHDVVAPLKWQTALGCRSGGNKNVTKRRAQELWPTRKWTHTLADAALIAEYGRRTGTVIQRRAT